MENYVLEILTAPAREDSWQSFINTINPAPPATLPARCPGSTAAPIANERRALAVSGAAVGCPGEGVRSPFSLIGKEMVP